MNSCSKVALGDWSRSKLENAQGRACGFSCFFFPHRRAVGDRIPRIEPLWDLAVSARDNLAEGLGHARFHPETADCCNAKQVKQATMRFDTMNHPVPWDVAESMCQSILRLAPSSIYVIGDPDGRVGYTVECMLSDPETQWPCVYADALVDDMPTGTDLLVWIGDRQLGGERAWEELKTLALRCEGTVICAEAVELNSGIGMQRLRGYDPDLLRIVTDEIPDGYGDNRQRLAGEEPMHWSVAQIAAWRFRSGAEQARRHFVDALQDLNPTEIGQACERILDRWPSGHEVLSLALLAAAEQGQAFAASELLERLEDCERVTADTVSRMRRQLKGFGRQFWRATASAEMLRDRGLEAANEGRKRKGSAA